jgi:PTS system galactitol-specific IIA component
MIWEELNPELIFVKIDAKSSDDVMDIMGKKFVDLGYCKTSFVEALKNREKDYPTGIDIDGFAIAMPHTDVTHVIKPGMAIGSLKKPVTFIQMGTEDDKVEVKLVVLLAIENARTHLAKMQEILKIFQDINVLRKIVSCDNKDEIINTIKGKEIT